MLPQHGDVPNFKLQIRKPALIILLFVVLIGLMVTAMLFLQAEPGDVAAASRWKLSFLVTLLLAICVLLAGSGNLLQPHHWKNRKHSHGRRHHHHHSHGSRRRHVEKYRQPPSSSRPI